jgi:peptide/nickel transport system permease protein
MNLAFGISRRVLHSFIVILGVSVAVFIVTHLVGDPVSVMLPLNASPEQAAALRAELGVDRPLFTQFTDYFASLFQGDFGRSYWQRRPALDVALDHVMPTVYLAAATIGLGALLGIPAGFISAIKEGTFVDRALSTLSITGLSIAQFWLSLILILVFAVELGWLPTSGYSAKGLILPMLASATYPFGQLQQIARAAMLDELGRPYIVAARSKGLSMNETVVKHAARNALIPVVTMAGFEFGRIVAGFLVVIEIIFNWPGIGYLTYQALIQRDYPLIQACILIVAVLVVTINLLVDVLYRVIDPRVRT